MKIVSQNAEYERRIEYLYKLYRSIEKTPPQIEPNFTVKITSEFQKDLYLYSSKEEKLAMDKEGTPELNGIVILPNAEDLTFTILITSKQFENDQVVHTAIHEFTHLFDYFRYFQENGNVYVRDDREKESRYFWEFCYWSEYHAKRLGTLIYSIWRWHEINGPEPPPDGKYLFQQVEFYPEELHAKIKLFNGARKSKSPNVNNLFWDLFHELMGYYGRLSVFQGKDLNNYPDSQFPQNALTDTLGPACIEVYCLLLQMNTFEFAKQRLQELRKLKEAIVATVNIGTFSMPYWFCAL